MEKILLLATGGTIDDLEYSDEKDAPKGRESIIPVLLRKAHIDTTMIHFEKLMLKDSDFITDTDRQIILREIQSAPEEKILITHGTKTMAQTAKFLGEKNLEKTIVLTGSMLLPSQDGAADAVSSLGFALSQVQELPNGVYVAMQESVFPWNNVRKNTAFPGTMCEKILLRENSKKNFRGNFLLRF